MSSLRERRFSVLIVVKHLFSQTRAGGGNKEQGKTVVSCQGEGDGHGKLE